MLEETLIKIICNLLEKQLICIGGCCLCSALHNNIYIFFNSLLYFVSSDKVSKLSTLVKASILHQPRIGGRETETESQRMFYAPSLLEYHGKSLFLHFFFFFLKLWAGCPPFPIFRHPCPLSCKQPERVKARSSVNLVKPCLSLFTPS